MAEINENENDIRIVTAFLLREYDEKNDVKFLALEKFLNTKIEALEKSINIALENAEKAVLKAELVNNTHFETINEFRMQLAGQTITLLPRHEFETTTKVLSDRVDLLSASAQTQLGKEKGIGIVWAIILGLATIISVCVAIIAIVFNILVYLNK